jgi:predicted lipoprotein with Yx(FWY)xxD motif
MRFRFLNAKNGSSSCAKRPPYYYVRDTAVGDVDGQGVDGVWFAVGADGKLIKPAG